MLLHRTAYHITSQKQEEEAFDSADPLTAVNAAGSTVLILLPRRLTSPAFNPLKALAGREPMLFESRRRVVRVDATGCSACDIVMSNFI